MSVPTFALLAPPIVNTSERIKVRAWHQPAAIADMVAYAISPDGIEYNITSHLRIVTTASFSFVELYIDFNKLGDHTIYVRDTVSSDWGVVSVRATEWASNMDLPISTLNKIRTELSRVRTSVVKGA